MSGDVFEHDVSSQFVIVMQLGIFPGLKSKQIFTKPLCKSYSLSTLLSMLTKNWVKGLINLPKKELNTLWINSAIKYGLTSGVVHMVNRVPLLGSSNDS